MQGWEHSGFAVNWERKLEAYDRKGLEGLLSYMLSRSLCAVPVIVAIRISRIEESVRECKEREDFISAP